MQINKNYNGYSHEIIEFDGKKSLKKCFPKNKFDRFLNEKRIYEFLNEKNCSFSPKLLSYGESEEEYYLIIEFITSSKIVDKSNIEEIARITKKFHSLPLNEYSFYDSMDESSEENWYGIIENPKFIDFGFDSKQISQLKKIIELNVNQRLSSMKMSFVHRDLRLDNYLINDYDQLYLIDYEMTAKGYAAQDITRLLIFELNNDADLISSFIKSYNDNTIDLEILDFFKMTFSLEMLKYFISLDTNKVFRPATSYKYQQDLIGYLKSIT